MSKTDLLERIKRVRKEISDADTELDEVFRLVKVSSDGEKVGISDVLGEAFQKLRSAKLDLIALEERLAKSAKD